MGVFVCVVQMFGRLFKAGNLTENVHIDGIVVSHQKSVCS